MNIHNIKTVKDSKHIPQFYKNILKSWFELNENKKQPITPIDICKEMIWGNDLIKFDGKVLIYQNWINSDILYIKDILDNNNTINENMILQKLIQKQNWISEFKTLQTAIPKLWLEKVKNFETRQYTIHVSPVHKILLSNGKYKSLNEINLCIASDISPLPGLIKTCTLNIR